MAERLEDRRMLAGPYAPAAGEVGSTAVSRDDPSIVAWATSVASYTAGLEVDAEFQVPANAIGPAEGTVGATVTLGRGGEITLAFDRPIRDGLGADFAVFENSFSDTFLELGYVEVSSNGVDYFRFENDSLTPAVVDAFGAVDPTEIRNLAGKYRQGFGTPFDLEELSEVSPLLDTTRVTHVRLIDVVGDGSQTDTSGDPIYDPFPTTGSAGMDVDAVAVIHQRETVTDVVDFEDVGSTLTSESFFNGPDPDGASITGPFSDVVVLGDFQSETLSFNNAHSIDFGSWNQWSYSRANDTTTPGFTNQFSSFAGSGVDGSATFGIVFPDQTDFFDRPTITRDANDTREFESLWVTNTTYAALSMRNGDSFAKKFGGADGNDEDFLLLTITGRDASGTPIGMVDFYLADYRFADNSLDYIVDQWVQVDLSPIAQARSLDFVISSSDVGPFGINTPAYAAIDDIVLARPVLPVDLSKQQVVESAGDGAVTVRISRSDADTATAINVALEPVDPLVAEIPSSVTIPAGERYVEFDVDIVDNDRVDGDRQIAIEASAAGYASSQKNLLIEDDDELSLTLDLGQGDLVEGSSRIATVSRNAADTEQSVTVQLATTEPSRLSFFQSVTIEAGQSTAMFTIEAVEDEIDRANVDVTVSAVAAGYTDARGNISLLDNDEPAVSIEASSLTFSESDAPPTTRFEDVGRSLTPESFYNGGDEAGGFVSERLAFNNQFNPTFGSWSGWSYSNINDTSTPGFTNQYSAFSVSGGGAAGSDTYAVGTAFAGALVPSITRDPSTTDSFHSIEITNTTYAALSMMQGDAFAKKFGGESGDDEDYFLLNIEGFDVDGASVGNIEFYLADFRFDDNSLDYIIDDWTSVDVSTLANAVELRFSLDSSDIGMFGMNTPAYFAVDNVTLGLQDDEPPTVTLRRNSADLSTNLEVQLSSSDPGEARLPPTATIPAGESSVDIPLSIINDTLADGDAVVLLGVDASSIDSSSVAITVADDDAEAIELTITSRVLAESDGQGSAVIYRNAEDTSQPLEIQLSTNPDGQLNLATSVTIPSGSRSTSFIFTPEDNAFVDGDRTVAIEAIADGLPSAEASVLINDDDVDPPTLTLEFDGPLSEADAAPKVDLEDLGARLASRSFDNGAGLDGGFESGPAAFNNVFNPTFGSWGGWSISNMTDTITPGFTNQYSAIAGSGAYDSPTYAVASAFPGGVVPTITLPESQDDQSFHSLMVTNTTYAALSMRDGDAFAKQFGGDSGNDPDFFLLTIEGRDDSGALVGTTEFYLADFRFDDNDQDYIVDDWTRVDLSGMSGAKRLEFFLSSSDVGQFGMNTPAYFAIDEIVLDAGPQEFATATVTRSHSDLSMPLEVALTLEDVTEASIPATLVIPAGSQSASTAVYSIDDSIADGTQTVEVIAAAPGFTPSSASLDVEDDDELELTLSILESNVNESEGSGFQLLVHRNQGDLSESVAVQVTPGDGIESGTPATIPAGAASSTLQFDVVDNNRRDGDRFVPIVVAVDGFPSSSIDVNILDDEVSELRIGQSAGITSVSESLGGDEIEISLSAEPRSDVVLSIEVASSELTADVQTLTFTPMQWDEPQRITFTGVPDLDLEDEEEFEVVLSVNDAESDPLFASMDDVRLPVFVRDFQFKTIRLGENDVSAFLVDDDTGATLLQGTHAEGLEVVANDLPQTILLDPLQRTTGPILVDAAGGDDTVVIASDNFVSISGGDGYDRLFLDWEGPVELTDLLTQRVDGFEEIVMAGDSGPELRFDLQQLESIGLGEEGLLLRTQNGQSLSFQGQGSLGDPVMIGEEFAQVVSVASLRLHVITPTPWQNALSQWDVNRSGDVTALDALLIVNQLPRTNDSRLPELQSLEDFSGAYYDVSGDGEISSVDALRVINEVARRSFREGELASPVSLPELDSGGSTPIADGRAVEIGGVAAVMVKKALFSTQNDQAICQLFPGETGAPNIQQESEPRLSSLIAVLDESVLDGKF